MLVEEFDKLPSAQHGLWMQTQAGDTCLQGLYLPPPHTHRRAHTHTYIEVGRMSCKSGRNAKDMRVPLLSMKSMQPNKYNKYDLTKA